MRTCNTNLSMTSDRDGVDEDGVAIPSGQSVTYQCHLAAQAVRVRMPDGTVRVVNPSIFPELR